MNTPDMTYFKSGRKICAYIRKDGDSWLFCTGKPSDPFCMSCRKHTYEEAMICARSWSAEHAKTFGKPFTMAIR